MENTKKPFLKTKWGIILTILFFPILLPIFVWKYTNFHKNIKIGITIFCIFLLAVSMVKQNNHKTEIENKKQEQKTEEKIPEEKATEVKTEEPKSIEPVQEPKPTENIQNTETPKIEEIKEKYIFDDIFRLNQILSQLGIGKYTSYKEDGMGGFYALTEYHMLGMNNIAVYLYGEKQDSAERIEVVININDASKKDEILKQMQETSGKILAYLDIVDPEISDAIASKKEIFIEEKYNVKIKTKIEKHNKESFYLIISRK